MRILSVLLLLPAANVHAHAGEHHGGLSAVLAHLVSEPFHLALPVAAIALVMTLRRRRRRATTASAGKSS